MKCCCKVTSWLYRWSVLFKNIFFIFIFILCDSLYFFFVNFDHYPASQPAANFANKRLKMRKRKNHFEMNKFCSWYITQLLFLQWRAMFDTIALYFCYDDCDNHFPLHSFSQFSFLRHSTSSTQQSNVRVCVAFVSVIIIVILLHHHLKYQSWSKHKANKMKSTHR